jgi:serine/threonine protein phosphatase 1
MTAATPPDTAIYAVGDIHGRHDLLAALTARIIDDAGRREARCRLIVYLGDYVSRGIDSRRVVDMVLAPAPPGFSHVCLKGNHEDSLLRFLAGDLDAGRHWFDHDGLDTLAHYGVEIPERRTRDDATMASLRGRFAAALPPAHLDFFHSLPAAYRTGGYYFAHAGVRPGVPLPRQSGSDCMWIREPFLSSEADHGAVVVHGHSISERPQLRHNRIGIDTGAYRTGILTCLVLEGAARAWLRT